MGTDKRERQKANTAARREQEAKEAKRRDRNRRITRAVILMAIVTTVILVFDFFGSDEEPADTTTTTTAPSETTTTVAADPEAGPPAWVAFTQLPTACGGTAPTEPPTEETWDAPEDLGLEGPVTAVITTSCGDITIELDPALAPQSVNSFVFLAEQGFYNRTAMHRSVPTFVLQGGDPTAVGTGDPGYKVVDEFPELGTAYPRGTVALAHSSAADSSGSQFFIVYSDDGASHLGSDETLLFNILGTVTDGFEALDALEAVEVDGQTPTEGIFIESIAVER